MPFKQWVSGSNPDTGSIFHKNLLVWHSFCILIKEHCGVEQKLARRAHNPEVVVEHFPPPATIAPELDITPVKIVRLHRSQ
jgi:hypothetical protein